MIGSSADSLVLDGGEALFFDFDGTLADIVPEPDDARVNPAFQEALLRLAAAHDGALALISGRALSDLSKRSPAGLWRIGSHGLEIAAPHAASPSQDARPSESVLAALASAQKVPGVRLEVKGEVAALHYRQAPSAENLCLEAAQAAAAQGQGLVVQHGKMVVEVKPERAHKGLALGRLMETAPFAGRRPIMFGDDVTDEDAMEAAQALGGLGVKVGDGHTVASLRFENPADLRAWVLREAGS